MKYPMPTLTRARRLLAKHGGSRRYYGADPAVGLIFNAWPRNAVYEEILVKVIVLNRLYSTNIYNVYGVAEHIHRLDIDDRLASGDETLVWDVTHAAFAPDQNFAFYSFATKYCAWHRPEVFVIYDSYVDDVLWTHQHTHQFGKFRRYELKSYPTLIKILHAFAVHFGLVDLSRKELDKYLWLEGRLAYDGVYEPD